MKKFIIQTVLLLSVIGIGIFFFLPSGNSKIDIPFLPSASKFSDLQINDTRIRVEISDTAAKRSKGLSGRAGLAEKEGMLFVFEKLDKYPFWMKGLTFPLDFVWIKGDTVVDLLEDVPAPTSGQKDADLPVYSSKVEVDRVLELNGGSVKKFNIKVGDTIKLSQ